MSRLLPLLLCVCAVVLVAAEIVPTPEQYLLPKAKQPIVIDGKLDDWNMAAAPCMIVPSAHAPRVAVLSNDPTNPMRGDEDLSARVAFAWDDANLYIAGDVIDDHLLGVKPDSAGNQGPAPWACDSIMISLNSFRQPMTRNSLTGTDPCIALRYAPGDGARGALVPGGAAVLDKLGSYWMIPVHGRWASRETPRGYSVEAVIPWQDLGFTPRAGERIFLAVLVPDIDPDENLNQVGWGWAAQVSAYPLFRLADREDMLGLLTTSVDDVVVGAAWSVRVEVDARKGTAKLAKVRIVDAKGAVTRELPVHLEVPQGQTGREILPVAAGAVTKPGRYTVEAMVGNAVLTRVPVRVVAPAPEAPLVQNPAGEVHHMRPARVTHHAAADHRRGRLRHNFVKGKADYLPFIIKYVAPGMKDTIRRMTVEKNRFMYNYLLYAVSLARATGDQEYVTLGRDLMDALLSAGTIDNFKLLDVAAYRALTWKQDPNSPFAPKDAEARYRALFYPIAATPPQELFNEYGTHNRVWHTYALCKIARLIAQEDGKPIDPRIIHYTDFHDKLIGEVGDADDASSGYHWVWSPPALAIYFHTGDWKGFLANKGYVKTFDRYVEMVSPSGGCPTFGSDGGWPQVGQSMWMFEYLSTLTRNGRYRWTSQRIAEYYYNHLYDDLNQYHSPADQARYNFALAYLFADDAVTPVASAPTSRITWRHPLIATPEAQRRAQPGLGDHIMDATRWIPDKLVLSGGNDARAPWALVDLLPSGGHAGETPGNICAMMQQDALLVGGQGYYELSPPFQNLLWVEDLDGLAADARTTSTEVPAYVDDPALTFARISTTAYQHLPVQYTRDIIFGKTGFMILKDRALFETTMKVRLGPCQQTRDLGPQCGLNWFNTYYDELYWTGLGLGYGVQSFLNPPWDLLVYFAPRADRKYTVKDDFAANPYRLSPVRVRQEWQGMARAGQQMTFTTVLLPHAPTMTPKVLVEPAAGAKEPARIEIIHDDDTLTVLKVISEQDPINKQRTETWVMLNDTGTVQKAGPLESDAFIALVEVDNNGAPTTRVMTGGTVLRYKNLDLTATARKPRVAPVTVPAGYK